MPSPPSIRLRPKFIASFTFRGFDADPAEIEKLVGKPASLLVRRGESRIPGGSPFSRSAASWKIEFSDETRLDEMIPALIDYVGGIESLVEAKRQIASEFIEFDIAMWIKDSEEQEGGSIEATTLESLVQLGATLSFGFYRRDDA